MIDAVIVGAGIAGLSAAWELSTRGLRALVLEAGERPGGVIVTERVDGFVIDGGPDALLAQKPAGVALAREVGLEPRLVPTVPPRTAFVVRHGRLVPLPEASFLGIPTRLGPFITTRLFSWPGKLRMALDLVVPARRDAEDESIGSFMRRRFGAEAVTYLAEPLLAGIHAGDVDRLSMQSLFPRLLEMEREHGSIIRAVAAQRTVRPPDGAFRSFAGGLDELVDAIVAHLPPDAVRCNARVTHVERDEKETSNGRYVVTLEDGSRIEAPRLVIATPARITASLASRLDATLASLCAALPYASTATVALGYDRQQVRHPLAGSGFVVPRVERRTLMAGTWVSSKWPGRAPAGRVLLRGFVGGDSAALQLDDRGLVGAVAGELAQRLDITGDPIVSRVFRWTCGTPQHEVGHQAWCRSIEDRVGRLPGLFLVGSSYRATGIPDVVADARRVACDAAGFVP